MIIEQLDLIAFGRFCDVSLDLSAGPRRFHLIYGPNESGKTTSLRAISALLFGIPSQTDDNYVHSYTQLRVGGRLRRGEEVLACVRRKGNRATLRGPDDQAIEEVRLERMLGGISAEEFSSRFGLTHQELVAGGSAILSGQGNVGEILFSAGLGIGRLSEIQKSLETTTQSLFKPSGKNDVINQGCRKVESLKTELRECQVLPSHFQELKQELSQLRARAAELSQHASELDQEYQQLRLYRHAVPMVAEWKTAQHALAQLGRVPQLELSFCERRLQAEQLRAVSQSRREQLHQRLQTTATELECLASDDKWLMHEAEIEAVYQSAIARNESQEKAISLREGQRNAERRMLELLADLSIEVASSEQGGDGDCFDASIGPLQVTEARKSRLRELAAQYERMLQQKEDAADDLETLKQRIETLEDDLRCFDGVPDPKPLSLLLDAIGSPQPTLDALAQKWQQRERVRHALEVALRQLHGFSGSFADAADLRLPCAEAIDAASADLATISGELRCAQSDLVSLDKERNQIIAELARLTQHEPLPTDDQLRVARASRDERLQELAQVSADQPLLPLEFEALREAIAEADRLVDTIREHHEQVHLRESLQQKRDELTARQAEKTNQRSELESRLQVATAQWNRIWQTCGIEPQSPQAMQQWVRDHQRLLEFHAQYQDSSREVSRTATRLEQDACRLRQAIRSCAEPVAEVLVGSRGSSLAIDDSDLGAWDGELESLAHHPVLSLYDQAIAQRNRLVEARTRYETLVDRRDEATKQRAAAQTLLRARTAALDNWYRDWNESTAALSAQDEPTPHVVLTMLDQIDRVLETKRKRDDIVSEIDKLEAMNAQHQARVEQLLAAIAEPLDERDAYFTVQRLYQRLKLERDRAKQREAVASQLSDLETELQQVDDDLLRAQAALDQLCGEAGCQRTEELAGVEQQSLQRAKWADSMASLETQLHQMAAGMSIDDFVAAVTQHHVEALEDRCRRLDHETAQTRQQLEEVQRAVGAKENELKRIDGSARASEIRQTIQMELGHLAQATREYTRLRIASVLLQQAMEHYRRENQGPVLGKAEGYFARLTCNEYQRLQVDFDAKGRPTLLGVRAHGTCREVPATAMSSGTADALYLALRLASLVHQMEQGKPFPLIIDDCLVQMDDRRSAAALEVFSEVSEKTQIILYTHHQHLIELAQANLPPAGFHLHRL